MEPAMPVPANDNRPFNVVDTSDDNRPVTLSDAERKMWAYADASAVRSAGVR